MATARRLAARGMSHRRIAATLTEDGHRSRRGATITHKQVGRWLSGPSSRGVSRTRVTRCGRPSTQ
jgi:hypothetical protein